MRTDLRALTVVAMALWATAAAACGVCIEDRVAAVYDQAVVDRATAQGQHVAFFGVEGDLVPPAESRKSLAAALDRAGVRGTSRVSLESATAAVAFDPRRTSPAAIASAAGRALAARGLRLETLRVTGEGGVLREP